MTNKFRGWQGFVLFNPTGLPSEASDFVADVESWSLEVVQNALETTTLADYSSSFRPGLRTASGSANLLLSRVNINHDRPSWTALQFVELLVDKSKQVTSNIPAYMVLKFNDVRGNPYLFQLRVWITQVALESEAAALMGAQIQFTVQGGQAIEPNSNSKFITTSGTFSGT